MSEGEKRPGMVVAGENGSNREIKRLLESYHIVAEAGAESQGEEAAKHKAAARELRQEILALIGDDPKRQELFASEHEKLLAEETAAERAMAEIVEKRSRRGRAREIVGQREREANTVIAEESEAIFESRLNRTYRYVEYPGIFKQTSFDFTQPGVRDPEILVREAGRKFIPANLAFLGNDLQLQDGQNQSFPVDMFLKSLLNGDEVPVKGEGAASKVRCALDYKSRILDDWLKKNKCEMHSVSVNNQERFLLYDVSRMSYPLSGTLDRVGKGYGTEAASLDFIFSPRQVAKLLLELTPGQQDFYGKPLSLRLVEEYIARLEKIAAAYHSYLPPEDVPRGKRVRGRDNKEYRRVSAWFSGLGKYDMPENLLKQVKAYKNSAIYLIRDALLEDLGIDPEDYQPGRGSQTPALEAPAKAPALPPHEK